MYKYSKLTNSFYPVSMLDNYTELPDDLIDVPEEAFYEFTQDPPAGKTRGANKKGFPAWVDLPPPIPSTVEELEENARNVRDNFLNATDRMMLADYTMGDYRLEDWQREELINSRDEFKRWPKSADFPQLDKLPTLPHWLYFEAVFLGWNAPKELEEQYL